MNKKIIINKKKTKIKVKNIYKIFGETPEIMLEKVQNGVGKEDLLNLHQHTLGLNNVSLEIKEGEIFVVMGLSGSGKSTLIRHFNRLIEPTTGNIFLNGKDILSFNEKELRELRRYKMSMVFQRFALLPHKEVWENIAYGLMIRGEKTSKKIVQEHIDLVGLTGYENQYPSQCSGGMQQRVGLARALATNPEILLMDEAFSALDPLIRSEMQDQLLVLQKKLNKTIIFITHDMSEAIKIGDRIAILNEGDVRQCDTPNNIIKKPADSYVKSFANSLNG